MREVAATRPEIDPGGARHTCRPGGQARAARDGSVDPPDYRPMHRYADTPAAHPGVMRHPGHEHGRTRKLRCIHLTSGASQERMRAHRAQKKPTCVTLTWSHTGDMLSFK